MKGVPLEDVMARLPKARQDKVRKRAEELISEYPLSRLRQAAMKKQSEIKGMTQDGVSRLENRQDWLVSSLNTYVEGMGGRLKIVAELPGVGAVELPVKTARAGSALSKPSARRTRSVR